MAALAIVAAAALAAPEKRPGFHVVFDATLPWVMHSLSHNAFSPTYGTEEEARKHGEWDLSADCDLSYSGPLEEPPAMVLFSNGLSGLHPDRAQAVALSPGRNELRAVRLEQLGVECHDPHARQNCFWFGQFTLHIKPGTGIPEGGARSTLDCPAMRICEPGEGGACFTCVQRLDVPPACIPHSRNATGRPAAL
eukprot:TRINITY_DN55434_c0_g1_i1.p2 TRINITY_DN55434_c0_g1~~TRINITY_DN55434_c0_g1_i1.p2  ORF type:complete len:216 (+),score=55.45 TRINITY_DN55434_c0_g1_i1:69-650(+)